MSRNSFKGGKRPALRADMRNLKAIIAELDYAEIIEATHDAIKAWKVERKNSVDGL